MVSSFCHARFMQTADDSVFLLPELGRALYYRDCFIDDLKFNAEAADRVTKKMLLGSIWGRDVAYKRAVAIPDDN